MDFEPLKDFLLVERALIKDYKNLVLPEEQTVSDTEVFVVIKKGPGDPDYPTGFINVGDMIAVVGYLNAVSYKGEKVLFVRARDVMTKIKEVSNDHRLGS